MHDLVRIFDDQWRTIKRQLDDIERRLAKTSIQPRAEVAGAVPVYATISDLPSAGVLGRVAAVSADNKLYFDNGTTWKEVQFV